jgi:hypothetical protein
VIMSKIGHGGAGSADYILIFRSNQKEPWNAISSATQDLISWKQLRGVTDVDSGSEYEYTYNVRLASKASPERVVGEFSKNDAVRQVTMITPENHLEL